MNQSYQPEQTLQIGLDIGSTTIKTAVLDGDRLVYSLYRRHHSDIMRELSRVFQDCVDALPDVPVRISVTGSGGVNVARALDLPFVQEVIAETEAIQHHQPQTDVIIELGGEDAKITYLHPVPEQRMNGSCAGGTGAFIDQMAVLLQTDAAGLDQLAARYRTLYPIASRCGVFAKSDLQPLINDGAERTDLAASIFQSVVNQTIAGLACGRPIRGHIVFLGGPLYFLPQLRQAFERTLGDAADSLTTPENAQLYVAIGAAMLANPTPVRLRDIARQFDHLSSMRQDIAHVPVLFADEAQRTAFHHRHAADKIRRADLANQKGPCYLGIDAGSTTTKGVLINADGDLVYSYYAGNRGNPVQCAVSILRDLYAQMPGTAYIASACVTGYGERLIRAALHLDEGEIETVAHYRAAERFCPDVDRIIDIGGQDMKCMTVHDGVLDQIVINEACSSGCGSFIQTFAESLGLDTAAFAAAALNARQPVDLGTRCTVFMNSRVKQAQKEGASVGDISAGLSYSVVRNALYKVIKIRDPEQLGRHIVVQGGTFLNDAVLRSFETLTGREVIRPDIAGLMGAFGAALLAAERHHGEKSTILGPEALADFKVQTTRETCPSCTNHCRLTVTTFSDGERFISGNRCERGAGQAPPEQPVPNLYQYKLKRVFDYRPLPAEQAPRGTIGIPRALNLYDNYPFWHTVLSQLGFRVILSRRSDHRTFTDGMDSIPSESVCFPAKLAHGHIIDLIHKGIKTIFYPDIAYEQKLSPDANQHYNCPIVLSYPEVIRHNVEALQTHQVRLIQPFLSLAEAHRPRLPRRLAEALADFAVTEKEARLAIDAGFEEDARFRQDIREKGQETLVWLKQHQMRGIVLAGRPYHLDPEINHGLAEMMTGLGLAVLTEDSVARPEKLERPLRVVDQWAYHTRLYEAAAVVAQEPSLELVQLNSFGCGLDAVTTDQVREILEASHRIHTVLKIDEVSNLGAARIRIRSLKAAMDERALRPERTKAPAESYSLDRVPFTRDMKAEHTILAPQMSPIHFNLIEAILRRHGYRTVILEKADAHDIETGLKYVNNDACYPSIIVVGQLIAALQSGQYDVDRCSVFITQTGGGCRATNYVAFLRKALKDAGFSQVPVVAISVSGIEYNPGFRLSLPLLHQAIQAFVIGDVLQAVLLRVRPYELSQGDAAALYERWQRISREFFEYGGSSPTLGRTIRYGALIRSIVAAFDQLPLRTQQRRPRIGLVGEILVKFHPDANNHAIDVIESEGCEAVLPGLLDFFFYCFYNTAWKHRQIGTGRKGALMAQTAIRLMERYRRPAADALRASRRFTAPESIDHLAGRASPILSIGNDSGEGWFLTAEMLELIAADVPNIICAQPFACLPNHVTGKGMIKALRKQHPQANIVAIDYDPGASEVNQLNRIRLMIATALRAESTRPPAANL